MTPTLADDNTSSASFWRRLRKTPVRDLLRLRLTSRLDFDAKLAAADLPPKASSLIRQTVQKTRLWKIEKAQVADELIAHFHDGRDADAPDQNLTQHFGDPAVTAKLIRRAKKRSRSLSAKAYVWTRRAAAALVLLYVVVAVRFYVGSPKVTVDYLVQVNADALAVPIEDQAWPIYRQAWTETRAKGDWEAMPSMDDESEGGHGGMLWPGDEGWPAIAAFLEKHEPLLDALRRGGQKPGLGLLAQLEADFDPADALALGWEGFNDDDAPAGTAAERLIDGSLINVLLPHLGVMRLSARLLQLDTRAALEQGDADRAVANVQAMLGLARQAAEHRTLINGLVGISIHKIACITVQEALTQTPQAFSDQQLQQLAHAFAAFSVRHLMRTNSERLMFEDLIQRTYTDDGHGDGRMTATGMRVLRIVTNDFTSLSEDLRRAWWDGGNEDSWALKIVGHTALPAMSAATASRKETLKHLDKLMILSEAAYAQPYRFNPRDALDDEMESWGTRHRIRYPMLHALMFGMGATRRHTELVEGRHDGSMIGIALELYRREHGRWPETLSELSPTFLPTIPVDRVTGEPLHYRVAEGTSKETSERAPGNASGGGGWPLVYSVGGDRDDDGGRPPYYKDTEKTRNHGAAFWDEWGQDDPGREGDWVIYPWPEN